MPVNNLTANRGYQLPDPTNQLDYDVGRIISAINGIDANVATLFASLSGKAATAHSHTIGDVTGLQAALDSKVGTGTNLPISQITNLQASLDAKANLAGADFTGPVTGVTPSLGANNTQFATTSWVRSQGFVTNGGGTWGISITGNAGTVTNGVYTTGNQTIAGEKTFSNNINANGDVNFGAGGTERRLAWNFTGRAVYIFGRDTDDAIGMYDTVLGGARWFTDTNGNFQAYNNVNDSKGDVRRAPINQRTSDYTLVASDAGKTVWFTGTGGSGGAPTINADVFSAGDMVTIHMDTGGVKTLTFGAGIYAAFPANPGSPGNRTLASPSVCTVLFLTPSYCLVTGAGVT